MKLNLALVFDTARRAHFINPDHVVSITAQGGTIDEQPVIEIGLSNDRFISVCNIGATEEDAIENLIAQLQEDAIESAQIKRAQAAPSERIEAKAADDSDDLAKNLIPTLEFWVDWAAKSAYGKDAISTNEDRRTSEQTAFVLDILAARDVVEAAKKGRS